MPRFGGKQDLTKIQIAERRRRRDRATRGRPTPSGMHPRDRRESEPWYVPMAMPVPDLSMIIDGLRLLMPRVFRPRAPRELKTKVKG